MKIAFFGQEEIIIGLASIVNEHIIIENPFEYFDNNKPDVVVVTCNSFSRGLLKNINKYKPILVLIGLECPDIQTNDVKIIFINYSQNYELEYSPFYKGVSKIDVNLEKIWDNINEQISFLSKESWVEPDGDAFIDKHTKVLK